MFNGYELAMAMLQCFINFIFFCSFCIAKLFSQLFMNVTKACHLIVKLQFMMMMIMLQEPDDGAIPSQFPISEDIQFCQLLQEATDFFGIEEEKMDQFFLVDHKTRELR